jgi:hypothetical protein
LPSGLNATELTVAAGLAQQRLHQIVLDHRACFPGRLGDRHPQLAFRHRPHQVAVLDGRSQIGVVGAAGLEICAHRQHRQRGGWPAGSVPGSGGAQRPDESIPLPLIWALSE